MWVRILTNQSQKMTYWNNPLLICVSLAEKHMASFRDERVGSNDLRHDVKSRIKSRVYDKLAFTAVNIKSIKTFLGSKEHGCRELIEKASGDLHQRTGGKQNSPLQ